MMRNLTVLSLAGMLCLSGCGDGTEIEGNPTVITPADSGTSPNVTQPVGPEAIPNPLPILPMPGHQIPQVPQVPDESANDAEVMKCDFQDKFMYQSNLQSWPSCAEFRGEQRKKGRAKCKVLERGNFSKGTCDGGARPCVVHLDTEVPAGHYYVLDEHCQALQGDNVGHCSFGGGCSEYWGPEQIAGDAGCAKKLGGVFSAGRCEGVSKRPTCVIRNGSYAAPGDYYIDSDKCKVLQAQAPQDDIRSCVFADGSCAEYTADQMSAAAAHCSKELSANRCAAWMAPQFTCDIGAGKYAPAGKYYTTNEQRCRSLREGPATVCSFIRTDGWTICGEYRGAQIEKGKADCAKIALGASVKIIEEATCPRKPNCTVGPDAFAPAGEYDATERQCQALREGPALLCSFWGPGRSRVCGEYRGPQIQDGRVGCVAKLAVGAFKPLSEGICYNEPKCTVGPNAFAPAGNYDANAAECARLQAPQ